MIEFLQVVTLGILHKGIDVAGVAEKLIHKLYFRNDFPILNDAHGLVDSSFFVAELALWFLAALALLANLGHRSGSHV